ncbi:hypothetical protein DMK78_23570 [Salmonella enterica]|uniref:hypothetical protein n=1 Tax=Escherichia coli TaxID=562 RepID=UPI000F5ED387|nr:hypothetical protein [Escherichia coli]EBA0454802.1 hypothetical protein [Salmonella enterica]EBX4171667.1 hypothetical protein [Salmonella enterica subsp. enterica serovar Stanley]AZH37145.1 hypothetical protein CRT46_27195 [Escherichia coli]EBN2045058.1 hypothetical protein [Salmonella enterica]EES5598991.1 hypothetical protein [Escherichia coli]
MKNAKYTGLFDVLMKVILIILALLWLPAFGAAMGFTLSAFHVGFSEIPPLVVLFALAALSINVTCYAYFKAKKKTTESLKYPFRLFFATLVLIPLAQGLSKTMADPFGEQSQKMVAGNVGNNARDLVLNFPFAEIAHGLLTIAPFIASVSAIIIVAANMYEALDR